MAKKSQCRVLNAKANGRDFLLGGLVQLVISNLANITCMLIS